VFFYQCFIFSTYLLKNKTFYNIKRMDVEIDTPIDMLNFYKSIKYLVIGPDKKIEGYSCLRDITNDICIDYSTISKRLSESNPCICVSKITNYVFLIIKNDII